MHERCVVVPDLAEKMYAVPSRKERRCNRVHGRVAPTLFHHTFFSSYWGEGVKRQRYLVVKSTATVEVLEECRVSLAAPKVHIGYLKVAPDCLFKFDDAYGSAGPALLMRKKDVQ
jgi:hypothetical protein